MIANSSPLSRPTVSPGRIAAAQPGGHLAEQLVAGRVPQGVVDLLEAVQVAEEHGQVGTRPGRGELGEQPLEEEHAVGQPGQGVVGAWCRTVSSSRARCRAETAWSPTPRRRASTSPVSSAGT